MFFSYLITEISILESLVQVIKKIFGIINKRTVQIGTEEGLEKFEN